VARGQLIARPCWPSSPPSGYALDVPYWLTSASSPAVAIIPFWHAGLVTIPALFVLAVRGVQVTGTHALLVMIPAS
jgi:hypothetical protein